MTKTFKKPVIGITTWRRDLPNFTGENDLYTLHVEYQRAVTEAGGLPVLLPHAPITDLIQYLDLLDALIVTGGGDVNPVFYGAENTGQSVGIRNDADQFEIGLIREAANRNIPTLGVCRGHQILQVSFGGKLMQDIYDRYPNHPRMGKEPPHTHLKHPVIIERGSLLDEIYQTDKLIVNSLHHQCVAAVGKGFKAIGWSSDGMIEAAQSETEWLAFGIQWHPEMLADTGQKVFDFFIQGVRDKIAGKFSAVPS
jgi:putative glutamine amidotransferase